MPHLVTGQQRHPVQHDLFFGDLRVKIIECSERVERRFLIALA
jgi:hypothetical protein